MTDIQKSYVKGVGWRSASKLTPRQRSLVPGSHAAAKGVSRADKSFLKTHNKAKKVIQSMPPGIQSGWSSRGGTYRVGGAKQGKSFVVGDAPTPKTRKLLTDHEAQHAKPKRSSYRLHAQIARSPEKLFREEARADWHSAGHYSTRTDTNGSLYGMAARYRDKSIKHPNRPMRGSKLIHELGLTDGRATNTDGYAGSKMQIKSVFPHYPVQGNKGDRAIDAYRGLQNKLRDKKVSKAMPFQGVGASIGTKWTTKTLVTAEKLAPKAPSAGYKGRRKLPKRGSLQKLGYNVRSKAAGAVRTVSHDATKIATAADSLGATVFGKRFEVLDMGGAMVTEQPPRDLPVRDLKTGRFVATPHLQKHSQAHDSLVWERENTDG